MKIYFCFGIWFLFRQDYSRMSFRVVLLSQKEITKRPSSIFKFVKSLHWEFIKNSYRMFCHHLWVDYCSKKHGYLNQGWLFWEKKIGTMFYTWKEVCSFFLLFIKKFWRPFYRSRKIYMTFFAKKSRAKRGHFNKNRDKWASYRVVETNDKKSEKIGTVRAKLGRLA